MRAVGAFLEDVVAWAARQDDVRGIGLAGSHARGDARATSDVDLLVLVDDVAARRSSPEWVEDLAVLGRRPSGPRHRRRHPGRLPVLTDPDGRLARAVAAATDPRV